MIFEVRPRNLAPVIRHAVSTKSATARANKEFPAGVESLRVLLAPELFRLAESGVMLPAAARVTVATYKAVQGASRRRTMASARRRQQRADKAQALADEKRAAAEEEKRKAKQEAKKARRKAHIKTNATVEALPPIAFDPHEWDSDSAPW